VDSQKARSLILLKVRDRGQTATNGLIAFYTVALANCGQSIAEPIEALCCVA